MTLMTVHLERRSMNDARPLEFRKGMFEIATGVHAFVSGSTDFGLSNAGVVLDGGEALVVDTLYDVNHAEEFRAAIDPLAGGGSIRYVFNTHSDGDHYFGNQVFPADTQIVATQAADAAMSQEQAALTARVFDDSRHPDSPMHPLVSLARPFDFHEVRVRSADIAFSGQQTLTVGRLEVELHELGPAHTVGDAIAYLPKQRVLFAGDLLTRDIVKVVWSGSITNWIAALETIRGFQADVVVPGHGPVLWGEEITDALERGTAFWSSIYQSATTFFDQGVPPAEAAARIDVSQYPEAALTLPTLIAVAYHDLDPKREFASPRETLEFMAAQIGRGHEAD